MGNIVGPIVRLKRVQVQEQLDCSYEGRLAVDPILLDRARLFGALEAGAFELANTRTHQNVVLHHLRSSMTESAIFLRELTAMVGRPYRIAGIGGLVTLPIAHGHQQEHSSRTEDMQP